MWLSTGTNAEYVCTKEISEADATAWEKLGDVHDAASSNHTHTVTVTGTNAASTVTGSVTVPTVSKTQKYLTATAGGITVTPSTDSVLVQTLLLMFLAVRQPRLRLKQLLQEPLLQVMVLPQLLLVLALLALPVL